MYGSFSDTVLIPTSELGNDVIDMLISDFYLTLYGLYCDSICPIKFILSHLDSMRLLNSFFTSLGRYYTFYCCKMIVFLIAPLLVSETL